MKQKYFFPLNYHYSHKFLGIIEYRLSIPLAIYAGCIIFVLHQFSLDLFTNIAIFTLTFLPIALLLNSNVNSEPFYLFFIAMIKHLSHSKIYLYQRKFHK